MPFRWKKKTRCNRFSQLVADHLQSPKHGGSLVVETGFPTSLIDLYVRNRGRFRKSAVKKQTETDSPILSPSPSSSSSGLLVDSINLSSSSSTSSLLVDSNNLSSGALDHRESDEIMEEDVVVGVDGSSRVANDGEIKIENSSEDEVEKSDELVKLSPVLVVLFKVLLMLALALGTKRFTVGITVSALFLFFLELVGKPLLVRSSSITNSVNSKTLIESKSKENTTPTVCSEVLTEIEEQVESNQEVRSEKELGEDVKNEVPTEIRHKSSRKAIMKSKMKKLVPKKILRSSIGSKDDLSCEFKDVKPLVSSSKCSDSKGETLKQEQDKIVEIEKQSSSSTFSTEIDCNDKESRTEMQQNFGYLFLFLIVLIGLIGGRFLAIVLALSWCVMLKKSPKWSNVKFPNS